MCHGLKSSDVFHITDDIKDKLIRGNNLNSCDITPFTQSFWFSHTSFEYQFPTLSKSDNGTLYRTRRATIRIFRWIYTGFQLWSHKVKVEAQTKCARWKADGIMYPWINQPVPCSIYMSLSKVEISMKNRRMRNAFLMNTFALISPWPWFFSSKSKYCAPFLMKPLQLHFAKWLTAV